MGRTLALGWDGGRAAIASNRRLYLVGTQEGSPATSYDLGPITDVTAVGDELWVTAGSPLALHRFAADGSPIGKPMPLRGESGVLRAVATGVPAALWTAAPQAMISPDREQIPIPGDPDCVIPVSLNRWVVCRRGQIALRDHSAERWSVGEPIVGARIVDGAVLFEGRSVALVAAPRGSTIGHLVVLSLHDGSVHHRIALTGVDLVRFAPARGFVLLRSAPRNLVLFDLRFGQVLKEHREEREIVDAALDNGGQTFIVRYGDSQHDVAVGSVRALLTAVSSSDAPPPNGEREVVEVLPQLTPLTPAPPNCEFHRGHAPLGSVAALSPRPELLTMPAGPAIELLERYREWVSALVGLAIARAWDDGRLVFPNEGALPFHGEVTGLLGRTAGAARAEVAIAVAQVARASKAAQEAEAHAGPHLSPLATLAAELGLSSLARVLLLLIGGPSLWGELARLYGILGNDDGRPLVDELLLVQILAGQADRHEIAHELDRTSPLVRHGLIRNGEGRMRPFLALTCEPIVLRLLRGADCKTGLDDLQLVPATRTFEELLIPAAAKEAIARAVAVLPAGPGRLVVRGRSGSGRHTLLATLAKAANRTLGVIDATSIVRDLRGRLDRLRIALRRAHLLGLLPCVDGLDALPADDPAARDLVAQVLNDHPGPVAVRLPWDGEPMLAPGYVQIDLPVLSIAQRTACWHLSLAEHALSVREPDDLADRYSVGPGVIARACAQVATARHATAANDTPADTAAQLEATIRQYLELRLKATATRVQRLTTWSRVVLPPDIQESVLELIARIKHRRTVYDTWGYDSVLTTSRGVTALFQGGPGTGKTLVASAIANELGMDLYRVDLSRILSKWIGETEQNLAKLFDAAEDGHAIILFDEADSLFAKRTEVRSSVDRYANLEVNYLLQRFDTFEGIAILTTNFGTAIDSAFKRRLSFRLTFPFPDEEAREALWRHHVSPGVPRAGEIDFAELARRYRLSGGYIRNAAVRAAFLAAEEHAPLTQDHLERAVKAEFREIGKIGEGGALE